MEYQEFVLQEQVLRAVQSWLAAEGIESTIKPAGGGPEQEFSVATDSLEVVGRFEANAIHIAGPSPTYDQNRRLYPPLGVVSLSDPNCHKLVCQLVRKGLNLPIQPDDEA